jgi:hypothetical protein
MAKQDISKIIKKAKTVSTNTVNRVTDTASSVSDVTRKAVDSATEKISSSTEAKKLVALQARQDEVNAAMMAIADTEAEKNIIALGDSPVELSKKQIDQIKRMFPVPREQCILWADTEFDLRPSGIVVTERGVFIKSDVGVFDDKRKETKVAEGGGKSRLAYFKWDNFDPAWFTEGTSDNRALSVDRQHSDRFIRACKSLDSSSKSDIDLFLSEFSEDHERPDELIAKVAPIAGAAVKSAETAVFTEQRAHINTTAGHGEMAEEAVTMLDKLHSLDAKVIGRDNAKDGADRLVDGVLVQTKYLNTARGSLETCFNPETGNYRYMHDGKPMQLEVPKDQYQRVIESFKKKISDGKVPGVTDTNEASNIVREGRLTYQQAVNLTKPGTIESLTYDAATGAVICLCAFGITFVVTVFLTLRKTGDLHQAIQAGASAGIQVFGISFLQHMVVSQVARTGLANSLMVPSQYIVSKLGFHTSATIVNGIRALSGKSAISGAAASKHLAKILRSSMLTSTITFAVISVPETYRLASKKITGAQYAKNLTVLAGSIAAGAGGAVAAGVVAAKIGGVVGTAVTPGIGTAVGIAGGFVGGAVGAKAAGVIGDILHENDIATLSRLFNAFVSCMTSEYMLNDSEMDKLVERLDKISQKEFKKLFEKTQKADEQEEILRKFLEPHFEAVVSAREPFNLPLGEEIDAAFTEIYN